MNKKVTIIVVTHNSRTKVADCLASISRLNYPQNLIKVIVVDNNSTDSTVGYISEKHSQVKLIKNKKNLGFAAGNNQGYYLAEKNQADFLFLANDDIILEPNCLGHLVKAMEKNKKIAAVQAKLLLYPEKDKINSFGNSLHYLGFAFCNYYRHQDNLGLTEPFETAYPSGAACLLRISALEKTGLFDDRLFMYHDDVDLGWRLRLAGYQVMLDPLAVAYHKYNYSKAKYKFYYMDRNRFIVLLQNYRLLTILLISPMLLFMELGIIIFSIKNGWFKEKIKGYLWIIGHLPSILAHRIMVQFKIRKVPDREVMKFFVGAIKFQEIDNLLLKFLINPLMQIYWFIVKRLIFW
ncbi:MAG: glycosyltransferase family 2 protein [Candidatus Buchananbacteria bacterium]|nr:glycosyltransferase family 2 protein [Candidatus Buchananbacteria bacterium]